MTRSTHHRHFIEIAIVAGILMASGAVHATLIVDATVSPIAGGLHYGYSITNNASEDVSIVSIVGSPGDPLIELTLTAPSGFIANYDSGLGFIDFLEATALFAVGTTTSGFGFDSPFSPGPTSFSALTISGLELVGPTQAPGGTPIPEPATLTLLVIGISTLIGFRRHIPMHHS